MQNKCSTQEPAGLIKPDIWGDNRLKVLLYYRESNILRVRPPIINEYPIELFLQLDLHYRPRLQIFDVHISLLQDAK
jgi:hypothetical protein